jgi:hypothetical protein
MPASQREDRFREEDGKEVYLLRIFRRGKKPGETLVGTVEEIRGRRKGKFKTGKELLDWLMNNAPDR